MRRACTVVLLAVLIFMVMSLVAVVHAQSLWVGPLANTPQPFRLVDVCPGYTISTNRAKAEVYLRCPPQADPWITIKECVTPTVTRQPNGKDVNIYCTKPVKT